MSNKIDSIDEKNETKNSELYSIQTDKIDKDLDIKNNEQNKIKQDLTAEENDVEYDNLKQEDEEIFHDFKNKEGIEVVYSFNGEEVTQGLAIFQKITIYKKNLIYSVILVGVFLMYATNFLNDTNNRNISILLAAISVGVLFIIWQLPRSHIKKTAEAADSSDMTFRMSIYDSGIKIGEENGVFAIFYNKEITKIVATQTLYVICVGKERVFILPKRFLNEEKILKITQIFIETMQENLIQR